MQKDNKAIFTRITVVDPDRQLSGWGGGGGGHPHPEIREGGGSVKKIFWALQASVWSKNKGGGGGVVPWIHHWIKHSKK